MKYIITKISNNIITMDNPGNIIIDWTRHAESCANLYQGTYLDYEPSALGSLGDTVKTFGARLTPSAMKAFWKYQPNLSFIGMQQSILLGTKYAKSEPYDAVFVSPTVRGIMTAMMALRGTKHTIHVIPYITEYTNWTENIVEGADAQNNPVPADILKRIVAYLKDWLEMNWIRYFFDIELAELLTSLKEKILNDTNTKEEKKEELIQLIDVILNCKNNVYKKSWTNPSIIGYDDYFKECIANSVENLTRLAEMMTKWSNVQTKYLLDSSKMILIFLDKSFIRCPPINFSYWDAYQGKTIDRTDQKAIFQKFYTDFLPLYFKKNNLQGNVRIMCVSHGEIMKKYFLDVYKERAEHPLNTAVFRETRSGINNIGTIKYDQYVPVKVRDYYKNIYPNMESTNMDICATESVKGMINYPLWDQQKSTKFIPTFSYDKTPINKVTSDNTFLFNKLMDGYKFEQYYDLENYLQYKSDDDLNEYNKNNVIRGGNIDYYAKYIKYKTKYMNLKSKRG